MKGKAIITSLDVPVLWLPRVHQTEGQCENSAWCVMVGVVGRSPCGTDKGYSQLGFPLCLCGSWGLLSGSRSTVSSVGHLVPCSSQTSLRDFSLPASRCSHCLLSGSVFLLFLLSPWVTINYLVLETGEKGSSSVSLNLSIWSSFRRPSICFHSGWPACQWEGVRRGKSPSEDCWERWCVGVRGRMSSEACHIGPRHIRFYRKSLSLKYEPTLTYPNDCHFLCQDDSMSTNVWKCIRKNWSVSGISFNSIRLQMASWCVPVTILFGGTS